MYEQHNEVSVMLWGFSSSE